ncbi:hypothetical protein HYN43_003175 [Mucilaginibacter celer]|uniref:Uncharacterized protein n=2 Tax=Mucilaginibacter celer TaxID=2305508 RepID=A0A494VSJ8_9SPHI|nr:hypothetical protein HYN43_003175 [Mucilaginibacter celer]
MPLWAIVSFIIGFFITHVFFARRFRQAAIDGGMSLGRSNRIQQVIIVFFTAFFIYASALALVGIMDKDTIPPMGIICAGLPLAILLFGVVGKTELYKDLLRAITMESLITLHVFRIIGIFFILLYIYDLLPAGFAFSAGLGDIITAVLAYPVAVIYAKGKSWRIPVVYAWNIIGIFDVVNLLIIAVIILKSKLSPGEVGLREIDLFPFSYFAAFAPAVLIFLHVAVFNKLNQRKINN